MRAHSMLRGRESIEVHDGEDLAKSTVVIYRISVEGFFKQVQNSSGRAPKRRLPRAITAQLS